VEILVKNVSPELERARDLYEKIRLRLRDSKTEVAVTKFWLRAAQKDVRQAQEALQKARETIRKEFQRQQAQQAKERRAKR
jgi:hypothetical protein